MLTQGAALHWRLRVLRPSLRLPYYSLTIEGATPLGTTFIIASDTTARVWSPCTTASIATLRC